MSEITNWLQESKLRKEVAGGQVEIYATLSQKRELGSKITNQPLETKITIAHYGPKSKIGCQGPKSYMGHLGPKSQTRLLGSKIAHGPLGSKITNRPLKFKITNRPPGSKITNRLQESKITNQPLEFKLQWFFTFFFSMGNAFQYVTHLKVNVVPANFLAQTLRESFPATKLAGKQPQGLFMLRKKSPPPDRYHKI